MPQHHQNKTPEEDKVSAGNKTAYGLGGLAENTMHNGIANMANPVFNVGLGVSPVLLGVASFIFRLWDAITDPVMGVYSDRFSSRLGRRRPFIIIGGLLAGLFFACVWMVPEGLSEMGYFYWFLGVSLLFYTSFTVFGVPYLALGYELSPDYQERTRVMAYRTWFASIGGIFLQWLFWLTQRDVFDGTVDGMRWVGLVMAVVMTCCAITPALFIKERKLSTTEITTNRENIKFRGMFGALKVRPFLYIFGALICSILGMFTVSILGFYINVYYVYSGDLKSASTVLGVTGTFYHLCCLLSIPMITRVSTYIGKQKCLALFLGLAVVGTIGKWWFFTPDAPYLQLVVTALMAPGLSALWTLLSSMTADVTDYDELENGTRREGSFGAIFNWTMKLGFAVCFIISGLVLEVSGFDESLGGDQAASTIDTLRFLYSAVPALGLAIAILLIIRFPINERTADITRREIERRKSLESN